MARVTSGHSVLDQASDRVIVKTGYSSVDGTKPSVKDRFRMGRSGIPDPKPPDQSLVLHWQVFKWSSRPSTRVADRASPQLSL